MIRSLENASRTIYTHIADENYNEALRVLEKERDSFPESVAIHSLMAYCCWLQ
jgi:tetratricopeptide repeat protein 30